MHTGPRGPLLFGWCTHYVPTTSHQPLAIFCTAPAPPHTLRAWLHCHIWTCLSIHVSHCLEDFSPQTSPSGIIYPMVGVPSMCPPPPINLWQYSTLHPHPHTHSKPGCTATFGCACPTMFPIAWRNFHHKPALVASVILWLEYLLCAHHLPSTSFHLPHCTCTHPLTQTLPSLPHSHIHIHPCSPLPTSVFTTNQPLL